MERSLHAVLDWAQLIVITQEPTPEARQILSQCLLPVVNVAGSEGSAVAKLEAV
jgi:hypothetical protein